MALSPSLSTSSAHEPNGDANFAHLIDKLDTLARFYQEQLDWVERTARVGDVNTDSDTDHSDSETANLAKPPTAAAVHRMHWRKQMRSLEAKLNGNMTKRRRKSLSPTARRKVDEEMGAHYILSTFAQMVGARMESCRRVQKLVAVKGRSGHTRRSPDQARAGDR